MEKGSLLSVCVCAFCWCQVGVYTSNAVGLCINRRLDTQFKRRYSCRLLYTADKHLMLSPTQCCVCASLHFLCRCSQLLSDQRHYLKRAINKRGVITGSGLAPPARPPLVWEADYVVDTNNVKITFNTGTRRASGLHEQSGWIWVHPERSLVLTDWCKR